MVEAKATPKHLWVVGIIALLWNLMGVVDYLMTETHNEAWMSQYTPEQVEYSYSFPAWWVAFWALAVWGGLLGVVLLLLRKKLATPVLLVSLICMVVTAIYNYGFTAALDVMGMGGLVFTVVIFAISLFLYLYSRTMAKKSVLV